MSDLWWRLASARLPDLWKTDVLAERKAGNYRKVRSGRPNRTPRRPALFFPKGLFRQENPEFFRNWGPRVLRSAPSTPAFWKACLPPGGGAAGRHSNKTRRQRAAEPQDAKKANPKYVFAAPCGWLCVGSRIQGWAATAGRKENTRCAGGPATPHQKPNPFARPAEGLLPPQTAPSVGSRIPSPPRVKKNGPDAWNKVGPPGPRSGRKEGGLLAREDNLPPYCDRGLKWFNLADEKKTNERQRGANPHHRKRDPIETTANQKISMFQAGAANVHPWVLS